MVCLKLQSICLNAALNTMLIQICVQMDDEHIFDHVPWFVGITFATYLAFFRLHPILHGLLVFQTR